MAAPSLTAAEMLAWNDTSFQRWLAHLQAYPSLLDVHCDVFDVSDLRGLLQHIVFVELRLTLRIQRLTEITPADIPADLEGIAAAHQRMMETLTALTADDSFDWDLVLPFQTRSMGLVHAPRRVILIHLLLHSVRHYAQMATIARHAGHPAAWPMDYLMMGVVPPPAEA